MVKGLSSFELSLNIDRLVCLYYNYRLDGLFLSLKERVGAGKYEKNCKKIFLRLCGLAVFLSEA